MNAVIEAMLSRRSVRAFRPEPVPKELLSQILEAGSYAASGMNWQSIRTATTSAVILETFFIEKSPFSLSLEVISCVSQLLHQKYPPKGERLQTYFHENV